MDAVPVANDHVWLRADIERVREYAVAHRDDWSDLRWQNDPQVRIVVRMTARIDEHRRALEGLVEHPDRLDVLGARHTADELEAVMTDATRLAMDTGTLQTARTGLDRVEFWLQASGERVAAVLHERYGDLISLTVGVLAYPPSPDADRLVVPGPPATDTDAALSLRLELTPPVWPAGHNGTGWLYVTNTGADHQRIMTGILVGWLLDPDTGDVVSTSAGRRPAVGVILVLAAGETGRAPVHLGTASWNPYVGYHLAQGDYDAMTVLDFTTGDTPGGERSHMRSPPTPVMLTAPDLPSGTQRT